MARSRQRGFSYLIVLVAVAVIGIVADAAYLSTWHTIRTDREAELMFRGQAFRRAIESYYKVNNGYPRALEDLLKDPHSPARKHIRRLYADPVAPQNKAEWLLVRAPGGGISGVASTDCSQPLKTANFPREFDKFEGAKRYCDWVFEYVAPSIAKPPVKPAAIVHSRP